MKTDNYNKKYKKGHQKVIVVSLKLWNNFMYTNVSVLTLQRVYGVFILTANLF